MSDEKKVLERMTALIMQGCSKKLAASIAVAEKQEKGSGVALKTDEKLSPPEGDVKE